MGFTEVIRYRRDTWEAVSLLHANGMTVGLMEYDVSTDDKFDERRIGLDHLSFEVGDRDELEGWVTHLDAKGVELEFFVHPRVDQVTELLSDENSEHARRMLDEAELRGRSQAEANWLTPLAEVASAASRGSRLQCRHPSARSSLKS